MKKLFRIWDLKKKGEFFLDLAKKINAKLPSRKKNDKKKADMDNSKTDRFGDSGES